jgi:serine/threonine-protein kinase
MSPEQISGEHVDRRADVFAVGVMLWEAVAGDKMWRGLVEAAIMKRVLNDQLPKLAEHRPDAPPELVAIIGKALASKPDERYQTAAALRDELEKYLASSGPPLRLRDLGRVVEELFADVRAETQRTVEAQLAKVSSLSTAQYATVTPLALTQLGVTGHSAPDAAVPVQPGAARSQLIAGALLLLALLVAWPLLRAREAPSAAALPSVSSAPAKTFSLHATAFPAAARLFLDGELLPSNPEARTVNADQLAHVLEARAEGFTTKSRTLRFDQDQDIVLSLEALPAATAPSQAAPAAKRLPPHKPAPSAAPPPAPVAPAGPDCNPPYTLDARGVKQFKLQCL